MVDETLVEAVSLSINAQRPLQPKAGPEQPLDNEVVEVAGDALAIGRYEQTVALRTHTCELVSQYSLAGQ